VGAGSAPRVGSQAWREGVLVRESEYIDSLKRENARLTNKIIDMETDFAHERGRALAAEVVLCLGAFIFGYAVAIWVGA